MKCCPEPFLGFDQLRLNLLPYPFFLNKHTFGAPESRKQNWDPSEDQKKIDAYHDEIIVQEKATDKGHQKTNH